MPLAADPQGPAVSGPVLLVVILIGATIFAFGKLWAIMQRANSDYKTTKAAVKTLRKGFWTTWWNAMKMGTWVAVVIVLLVAWVVHDVRAKTDATPAPSPSAGPSKKR